MGTMLGNVFALIIIIASGLVGFISFEASATTFVITAYFLWLCILLSNHFTRPAKDAPLCKRLSPEEVKAYQRYHIHFRAPGSAQAYSALLNALRFAGIIWGALPLG